MHPPRKRESKYDRKQSIFETRGRAQRPSPTQRLCFQYVQRRCNRRAQRSAVECGAGGPLAGLDSFRILQASTHSAAGRAGTIDDGNILRHLPNTFHPPSGMVDPHDHKATQPSPAEPTGQRDFASHPATSARTRCIYRASASRTLPNTSNRLSKRAGGHSGPPLHRDLASATQTVFMKTTPSPTGGPGVSQAAPQQVSTFQTMGHASTNVQACRRPLAHQLLTSLLLNAQAMRATRNVAG